MGKKEIDAIIDEYQLLDSFPLIPRQLVHCVCEAETSYMPKEYYRHEPDYWSSYMFNNLKFWKMLYRYQFGVDDPTAEQISKTYAASYGIMQVMYDIALDIYLKSEKDTGLSQVINEYLSTGVFDGSIFKDMELPESLKDDAIGVWYGMFELEEKMQTMYKRLASVADEGQGVAIEGFLNGDALLFNKVPVKKIDFFKFTISSYQAGTGTLTQLLKLTKPAGVAATWKNVSDKLLMIRSVRVMGLMLRHIERAFRNVTEEDFEDVE